MTAVVVYTTNMAAGDEESQSSSGFLSKTNQGPRPFHWCVAITATESDVTLFCALIGRSADPFARGGVCQNLHPSTAEGSRTDDT